VVNHWRLTSPDEREVVLASEASLIDERDHRDTPLVVIDTRDLFHAVRAVEDQSVGAEQVRSSLSVRHGAVGSHRPTADLLGGDQFIRRHSANQSARMTDSLKSSSL
jgi:hypothetical protein